ncbi:kinase-like domain-containing protein [Mycena sanguinolenta]|nr:kinase-like domain-containing protein [Mycena sanguinolenta]
MLKAAIRVIRNYVKGYSNVQAKVYDATSSEPVPAWGPAVPKMHEIAQLTHNLGDFVDVMETLETRLNDKDWLCVWKSLILLEYLLRQGSQHVIFHYGAGTTNRDTINKLRNFEHVDGAGRDRGLHVRGMAQGIFDLLQDEARLRSEYRARAKPSVRDRMTNGASESGYDEVRPFQSQTPPDEISVRLRLNPPAYTGWGCYSLDESSAEDQRWNTRNVHQTVPDGKNGHLSRRAVELRREQPEDVNLRLAIETSPTSAPAPKLIPPLLPQLLSQRAQLLPRRPQGPAAEQTADARANENTPSATESKRNVSSQSEGPASWQTEAYIDSLLASWERRRPLLSMIMSPDTDRRGLTAAHVRQRLGDVEAQISVLLIHIIGSKEARVAAQRLESDRAQSFVDAIQDALDRGTLPDPNLRSRARRLMQKVSEAGEQLPSSLFIEGVNGHDKHPTFGGGFGDVYQASYQGRMVALKRIRIFTADSTTHRIRLQFHKEALVWQSLRHRFILPLLGIDHLTFAPSFCMVSPWMKHGTVLKYLRDQGRGDVNRLLLEIAQGLDYLHSMNVVHGDLRGNNILISDDGNACLSDFGLATTIADADSTVGFTSSSNRAGSVRWFAPELIDPAKFGCKKFIRTKASDVYAYACVCLELYTGDPPFSHLQDVAAMLRVIGGERPEQPPSISAALWQLVISAWVEDFRARPPILDIAVALEGIS